MKHRRKSYEFQNRQFSRSLRESAMTDISLKDAEASIYIISQDKKVTKKQGNLLVQGYVRDGVSPERH